MKTRFLVPPLSFWLATVISVGLLMNQFSQPREGAHTVDFVDEVNEPSPNLTQFPWTLLKINYGESLHAASTRPIFSETRALPIRPSKEELPPTIIKPVPKKNNQPKAPPVPPAITYLGFVSTHERTSALVSLLQFSEEKWVSIDDELLGWTIHSITENELHIVKNEFQHVVEITR